MNTRMWRAGATLRNLVAGILMLIMLTACGGGGGGGTTNKSPLAKAGVDITVQEGENVVLDGKGSSDPDGSLQGFSWEQIKGDSITIKDADKFTATFTAMDVDVDTELEFRLTVTDNDGASASDTIKVTVLNDVPDNVAPIVVITPIGPVTSGASVTLDGSASSDADGSIVSYQWTLLDGESIDLFGADTAVATFTAPDVGSETRITFSLKVTDDRGESSVGEIEITINPLNDSQPVAHAGNNRIVNGGDPVTLSAMASHDEETPVTALGYAWVQTAPEDHPVTLNDSRIAEPGFTAPDGFEEDEIHLVFEVTVTDSVQQMDTASVIISVARRVEGNNPPVADAGEDFSVDEKDNVSLGGGNSHDNDPGDSIASYQWTYLGSDEDGIVIVGADTPMAFFTAPTVIENTPLDFMLTVRDTHGAAGTDEVTVTIDPVNDDPVIDTFNVPSSAREGAEVMLTAGASDEDEDALTYEWVIEGSDATIIPDAESPGIARFTVPEVDTDEQRDVTVTVTDGNGGEAVQTAQIEFVNDMLPEAVATANPSNANGGQDVTLDGSQSSDTEDGTLASYFWRQIVADETTPSVQIINHQAAIATFVAPTLTTPATLEFELKVMDSKGQESTATTSVTIAAFVPDNIAPVAEAGAGLTVNETTPTGARTQVQLNGGGSSDEDGTISSYEWRQVIIDDEPAVEFTTSTNIQSPRFNAPDLLANQVQETLTFELLVRDNLEAVDTDQVEVIVNFVNLPPSADAGADQTVDERTPVQLSALGSSDPDDQSLTYTWARIAGPFITFDDPSSPEQAFLAPAVGPSAEPMRLRLTVSDGVVSHTDDVLITVNDTGPITTPDPFVFADSAEVNPYTQVISMSVSLVGFDTGIEVSLETDSEFVGQYFLQNMFTSQSGQQINVEPNNQIRIIASLGAAPPGSMQEFTVTAGEYSTTWSVIVRDGDQDPDAGSFTIEDVDNVSPGTQLLRAVSEPSGFDMVAPLVVEVLDGNWSAAAGFSSNCLGTNKTSISPGESFCLRLRAPSGSSFGQSSDIVVRIGATENRFTATVRDAITTPDPFTIPPLNDAEPGAIVESAAVQLQGLEAPASVSVEGGEIAVSSNGTDFGEYAASVDVPVNGYLRVRTTASVDFLGTTTATVSAGDVTADFAVTTRPDRPTAEVYFPYGENSHTTATSITARGIASASTTGALQTVKVGENFATLDAETGEWQIELDLQNGENRFDVSVADDSGENAQAAVVVAHHQIPVVPDGLARWVGPDGRDYFLTVSSRNGGLIAIDRATMERKIISGPAVGSGVEWVEGGSLLVDQEDNMAYLHAPTRNAVVRINLLNGQRAVVSGTGQPPFNWGNGPANAVISSNQGSALAIWNHPEGKRLVIAQRESAATLVSIKLLQFGDRTILAGDTQMVDMADPPGVGPEDALANPVALAIDHREAGFEDDIAYLLDNSFRGRVISMLLDDSRGRVILTGHDGDGFDDGQVDGDFGTGPMWMRVTGMTLQNGRLLTGAGTPSGAAMFEVDAANGGRSILSDDGDGPIFAGFPGAIVVDPLENAAYVDGTAGGILSLVPDRIVRVDLEDGIRSYFIDDTNPSIGDGTSNAFAHEPYRAVWDSALGRILAKSSASGMPVVVDPVSGFRQSVAAAAGGTGFNTNSSQMMTLDPAGNRVLLTSRVNGEWGLFAFSRDEIASGPVSVSIVSDPTVQPSLPNALDIVVDQEGRYAYWLGFNSSNVWRIDLETGVRELLVDIGGGYSNPSALAFSPDGQTLYVSARFLVEMGAILEVDLGQSLPVTPTELTTFNGDVPHALTVLPDGHLLVVKDSENEIIRIDPANPSVTTTIASNSLGDGPLFGLTGTAQNTLHGRKTPGIALGPVPDTVLLASNTHNAVLLLDLVTGDRVFLTKED